MLLTYRCYFVPAFALALFLLSGCEAIFYGAGLTSAAAANELVRYSLPELKDIDHIALQRDDDTLSPATPDSFKDPLAVTRLVQIFNDNRHFWKKEFRITPPTPHDFNQPGSFTISVYNKSMLIRSYHFGKNILSTHIEAGTIVREVSDADADSLSRLAANVNNQLLYFPKLR